MLQVEMLTIFLAGFTLGIIFAVSVMLTVIIINSKKSKSKSG